jgi:hypothetical protein
MEYAARPPVTLRINDRPVIEYVTAPRIDPERGPRPFAHPVRTLAGAVVTDVLPEDHPHHLGVSVAMQDVNGVNLWGGRTYVRDQGYQWLDDHGRITADADPSTMDGRLTQRLRWRDIDDRPLLIEDRTLAATALADHPDACMFDLAYALTNRNPQPVTLGSPATNGRPGNAGYGGFFWRMPMSARPVTAMAPDASNEEEVNGSAGAWVAMLAHDREDRPYSLVFSGLGDDDRWFVRAAEYPGVCVALAFERPRPIAPGATLRRRHLVAVVDGHVSRAEAEALSAAALTAAAASRPPASPR